MYNVQYAEDQIFKALEPTYLPEGYKEIDRKTKDTSQSILYKDRAGRTLSYEQYIYDTRISLF
ncbi:hypothetical protein HMPREF1987_01681 [Peptostreptococcaceae bacterium oral taxon 113 str. W5053]|nr:hypothetical protein HMPREF1987_01681 [Peptostreptococcaceae bacterium oral taxon 113 str. W5053]